MRRACLACGATVVVGTYGGLYCLRGHAAVLGWAIVDRERFFGLGHAHVAGVLWPRPLVWPPRGKRVALLAGALCCGDQFRYRGAVLRVLGSTSTTVRAVAARFVRRAPVIRLPSSTVVRLVRIRAVRVAQASGLGLRPAPPSRPAAAGQGLSRRTVAGPVSGARRRSEAVA